MQVSVQGSVTYTPASGSSPAAFGGTPGNWLIQYAYDGLGRLIRAQRPWPQPGSTLVRIEHYYYDGVRRVQEVFIDPVDDVVVATKGVNSKEEKDISAPVLASLIWTAREYIWGPDYVDELVAQIAPSSNGQMGAGEIINYALTGHAGTVTALLDVNGAVKGQYSYDPYGEILASDEAPGLPRNRVGHQGLFFDRLNGTVNDQQLGRGNVGIYYNRNRTYSPGLGRFLQRDPNGGSKPLSQLMLHGHAFSMGISRFNAMLAYRDGVNSYGYVASGPTACEDPRGTDLCGGTMDINIRMDLEKLELAPVLTELGGLSLRQWFLGIVGTQTFWLSAGAVATVPAVSFASYYVIEALREIGGGTDVGPSDPPPPPPPPDNPYVVRGGTCLLEYWQKGAKRDDQGRMLDASVNSGPVPLAELAAHCPQNQIGVSTLRDIELNGGQVVPSPTGNNPWHCDLIGITPEKAVLLFVVQPNPVPKGLRR